MLYLFYGDDDYSVQEQARQLQERYAEPDGFNVQRLDGATASWNDVVGACSVLPFLSQRQVVRISGLIGASSRAKATAEEDKGAPSKRRRAASGDDPTTPGVSADGLSSFLASLPETTILILEEGDLKPGNAHLKALNALDMPKEVRRCAALVGEERTRWVRDAATARGGAIEPAAAMLLAERVAGGLATLSNTLVMLLCYAGPGGRVTTSMVQDLTPALDDDNVFHLSDAIANKDAGRALTLLHTLSIGGMAEEQMLAILVGRVRDWVLLAALNSERVSEAEALQRLGWQSGKYRAVLGGVKRFARGELPEAYQALVVADEALKSRPGDERPLIFDLLIITLATRGKAEALRQAFPVPVTA